MGTEGTTNVVSYERISADKAKDRHGVADQRRVNAETASRLGWTIVRQFRDNDLTASKATVVRPDFEAMLVVLRDGHLTDGTPVQGVVVVNEDRLYRRAGDYERFVEALTFEEGRVFADARGEKDLYSDSAEVQGLIGVAVSKAEIRKIRRRLRQSHRARAEEGKPVGGTRPFGWAEDRMALDPTEAPLVCHAVEALIAGRTVGAIVADWNRRGVRTSLGNPWSPRSLKLSLGNPRICGWRRLNGELVRGEDGEPVRGHWTPIVTPEQWMAVDTIFSGRRGMRVRPDGTVVGPIAGNVRGPRYLLTGVARCGRIGADGRACGAVLRVNRQKDCAQHIYTCPGTTQGGCGGLGRRGDKVDEFVSEAVLAKLEERHRISRGAIEWPGSAELARVETKLGTLRVQWSSDVISDELFFPMAKELEAAIRELRTDRNRHTAVAQRAAMDLSDIRRRWFSGELDLSQKRAYIGEALHAVIVHPVGKGRGSRSRFDPSLLTLVWRED
jgi:DNA invertase Pin-like site-specific DNA recombinase